MGLIAQPHVGGLEVRAGLHWAIASFVHRSGLAGGSTDELRGQVLEQPLQASETVGVLGRDSGSLRTGTRNNVHVYLRPGNPDGVATTVLLVGGPSGLELGGQTLNAQIASQANHLGVLDLIEGDALGVGLHGGFDVGELSGFGEADLPADNKDLDENAMGETEHECPKCHFKW